MTGSARRSAALHRQRGLTGPALGAWALLATLVAGWQPSPAAALTLLPVPDTASVVHDRTLVVPAPGVLANDIGLGGGATAILDTTVSHGTLSLASDGGYTYVPAARFVGTDQFTYHPSGLLATSTSVTISVTNSPPVAAPDAYSAVTGVTLSVPAPGVLGNDVDADGDRLSASLVDAGGNGSLTLRSDGSFTFKSGGSFTGAHTFTYRATDGVAWSSTVTVTIDVRSPTPTATPVPTPTPTPTATAIVPPPTLPLPTLPLPLPTLPGQPTPTPTARPSAGPSTAPDASPASGADGTDPTSSPGSGPPAAGIGGLGGGGGSEPGAGGGPRDGGFARGPGALDVAAGEGGPGSDLTQVGFAGLDAMIEWAVPAVALTVPGLLLILVVLAQMAGGAIWLPVARRWLGGFGIGRHGRSADG